MALVWTIGAADGCGVALKVLLATIIINAVALVKALAVTKNVGLIQTALLLRPPIQPHRHQLLRRPALHTRQVVALQCLLARRRQPVLPCLRVSVLLQVRLCHAVKVSLVTLAIMMRIAVTTVVGLVLVV